MSACLRVWAAASFALLVASTQVAAANYGFRILRAELRPVVSERAHEFELDADIDYRFSEAALDALRNGVSLTLILRLKIQQERGWWWPETLLDETRPFRVRYHALSKLYQILDGDGETPRNFVSVNAMLEAMGTVRNLPVGRGLALDKGELYRASLSVALDIESLPLPLRPVAYVTPAWYLDSSVYQWSFAD
jgi:hypothetical protein